MKLLKQIFRFGITGVICFIVDFGVYVFCMNILGMRYLLAGAAGFVVSTMLNYVLSARFVFKMDVTAKTQNAIRFYLLSGTACLVHEGVLFVVGTILLHDDHAFVAKVLTTGIVMVYNFITRKIFLEEHGTE